MTRRLDIALTPRAPLAAEVVIAIDCIRATTTIGRAIAAGYEQVICVPAVAQARRLAAGLEGAVLGGERNGVAPPGFQLGNSPAEYDVPHGRVLVLTTTNGTRAILQATREGRHVLVGSLGVLEAVSRCALELAGDGAIGLRCAGADGRASLDDVAAAGRFAERLLALDPAREPSDAARIAMATARAFPSIEAAIAASSSARGLIGTGFEADVVDCAREDVSTRVPIVAERWPRAAVVAPFTP
jgi:2-phosphosulfolactate phosphatase